MLMPVRGFLIRVRAPDRVAARLRTGTSGRHSLARFARSRRTRCQRPDVPVLRLL
ncbi:hypothetical protein CZ774_04620 [Frigoribacterium sp. JB110]|nr:hypothetical protein CZ774_04620 [Frigoribacterium sp. JB110]